MFSQWATKRVCKFFMKRLLGRMLRSELDLEQLDVQLGFGTIQLKDLFLNTDYLNDQLGDASVVIKEGSIGRIRAKIPWKVLTAEPCEIDVDELKLVVVPRTHGQDDGVSNNTGPLGSEDLGFVDAPHYPLGEADAYGLGGAGGGAYMGVDDGVRMIAKMVERVLLGLRVRVTNLIVVFEESLEKFNDDYPGDGGLQNPPQFSVLPHCLIIARVTYLEYGVAAPQQSESKGSWKNANGSEPSILEKVLKFQGATVEVVDVQDEIGDIEDAAEESAAVDVPLTRFLGQPLFIVAGETGGLAGSIQLSVPWKDGTLDVPKVHADLVVETIKLKLAPHQIKQLLTLAQAFRRDDDARLDADGDQPGSAPPVLRSSTFNGGFGSAMGSRFCSGGSVAVAGAGEKNGDVLKNGSAAGSLPLRSGREAEMGQSNAGFLPMTRFISDWMQWAGKDGPRKEGSVAEADLAASVDEFFECFDGTRSSQASASGSSSGMWNWTRSAFSAITAASSLASGSIVLPLDAPQQPEYSMKVRLSGISLDLFYDRASTQMGSLVPTRASELCPLKEMSTRHEWDQGVHDAINSEDSTEERLNVELFNLNLSMSVSGSQTEFSAIMEHLDVSEVALKGTSEVVQDFGRSRSQSHVGSSVPAIQLLQSSIESALPSFPASLSHFDDGMETSREKRGTQNCELEESGQLLGQATLGNEMYEKKQLLRVVSEPDHAGQLIVTWQSPPSGNVASSGQTEVTASLQPLIIWLDVYTLKRIVLLLEKTGEDSTPEKKEPTRRNHTSGLAEQIHEVEKGLVSLATDNDVVQVVKETAIERGPLEVKLIAPCVRVIICFPVARGALSSATLQNDFIALDMNSRTTDGRAIPPTVEFKHLGEKKKTVPADSFAGSYSLIGRIRNVSGILIYRMDGSGREESDCRKLEFTTSEILLIREKLDGATLFSSDRQSEQQFGAVEFQWNDGREVGPWMAKKTWDRVSAQQRQGDGGRGIGGSNSEFAAATTAAEVVEEEHSHLRKELLACSSSVVRVDVPQIKFRLSEPHYSRVVELMGCFIDALIDKGEATTGAATAAGGSAVEMSIPGHQTLATTSQTSIFVHCGHVDLTLDLKAQHQMLSGISKPGTRAWDVIRLSLENLQVLSVMGVGGCANCSYLWVHHEDSAITGSFASESPGAAVPPCEEPELLLLSCKREVLGRGDGGGGNALASGKAGLTLTHMVWPGQEQLGDALLTGAIRGITFVAHSGRLDWLSAVSLFFDSGDKLEDSEAAESSIKSTVDDVVESDSEEHDPMVSPAPKMRTFFLLDFHDVALGYEPGSETILVPGVVTAAAAGRDVMGRPSSSAESSQIIAPVACVVAAAALRVSSSIVPRVAGEQYDIWLRDVALHLLDTTLKKQTTFDYTRESMHRTGYVQIAKEAVMEAVVRIDSECGLLWELECANNQLRFDFCQDTTAAFGRLVAQLQQLFVPEIETKSGNLWKADGSSTSGESPGNLTSRTRLNSQNGAADAEEADFLSLFDGVLEDAFSRVRSSWSSATGDDDASGDLPEENYSVINAPLHGRASSIGRHDSLDREKLEQEFSGSFDENEPSTPTTQPSRPLSRTPSEESVVINNTGLPTFIEDYYMNTQKRNPPPLASNHPSRENRGSPRHSSGSSSRQASRESTSSGGGGGGGREAEGKGVWYAGNALEVVEDHVPDDAISTTRGGAAGERQSGQKSETQNHQQGTHSRKVSLPKKYPPSVGRVVLRDLSARWRFYGGLDWPASRTGREQQQQQTSSSSPSQSYAEESGRQSGVCMEVLLDGMKLQYDAFPAVGLYASRLTVSIRDIGVYDCSNDAPWGRVLGYHRSKSHPRESSSQAVKIEMDAVRPDPLAPLEEYRLSIALLPIRLHLDQRHIDFCVEFFSPNGSFGTAGLSSDEASYPVAGVPTSGMPDFPSDKNDLAEVALLPFFQICEMRPLTVRVDYLPRRVDLVSLRGGNYAELLNLVSWKGIELNLKHVRAAGVHGWSSLSGVIFGEWLEDISQNQVHKFVRGVGPIRPLYAVGSGAAKLVALPAEHYKKDRRLFRGMQKGAVAFVRSISLEALGLGAHLAAGAHDILQHTEVALGGAPIPVSFTSEKGERRSRAVQPGDTREGLQQAYESISQGLERTASGLLGNPLKVYQRGAGAGLAVASALRAAPAAAVAPASAAVGAFHRAILGVRNELDPEKKRESDEKHTGPPPNTRRIR